MQILVIGGTNFIGPSVVRQLCAMDCQVTVFSRGKIQADLPPRVNYIHGDRSHLANTKVDAIELPGGHCPYLSHPAYLADVLTSLLE